MWNPGGVHLEYVEQGKVLPSTQPRANTVEDLEAQQPHIDTAPPRSTSNTPLSPGSALEGQEENDPFDTPEQHPSVYNGTGIDTPLPARLAGEYQGLRRARTTDTHASMTRRLAINWIVPVEEKVCSVLVVLTSLHANQSYIFTQAILPTLSS